MIKILMIFTIISSATLAADETKQADERKQEAGAMKLVKPVNNSFFLEGNTISCANLAGLFQDLTKPGVSPKGPTFWIFKAWYSRSDLSPDASSFQGSHAFKAEALEQQGPADSHVKHYYKQGSSTPPNAERTPANRFWVKIAEWSTDLVLGFNKIFDTLSEIHSTRERTVEIKPGADFALRAEPDAFGEKTIILLNTQYGSY